MLFGSVLFLFKNNPAESSGYNSDAAIQTIFKLQITESSFSIVFPPPIQIQLVYIMMDGIKHMKTLSVVWVVYNSEPELKPDTFFTSLFLTGFLADKIITHLTQKI